MTKERTLQQPFLETLRREEVPVAIYLVNGIKLQGSIEAFDSGVILLKSNTSQMIYKHAVSTIVPMRKIVLKGFDHDLSIGASEEIVNQEVE